MTDIMYFCNVTIGDDDETRTEAEQKAIDWCDSDDELKEFISSTDSDGGTMTYQLGHENPQALIDCVQKIKGIAGKIYETYFEMDRDDDSKEEVFMSLEEFREHLKSA